MKNSHPGAHHLFNRPFYTFIKKACSTFVSAALIFQYAGGVEARPQAVGSSGEIFTASNRSQLGFLQSELSKAESLLKRIEGGLSTTTDEKRLQLVQKSWPLMKQSLMEQLEGLEANSALLHKRKEKFRSRLLARVENFERTLTNSGMRHRTEVKKTAINASSLSVLPHAQTAANLSPSSLASTEATVDMSPLASFSANVESVPAPQPSGALQTADLEETPEVLFSNRIDELLANDLFTPADIFEFVLNEFEYEPYYGSLKGSERTLLEKAGNDLDQASLLIALLRRKGIPAHYVWGTADISLGQAKKITGINDSKQITRYFLHNGIPVQQITTAGGEISAIRINHYWVRAQIGYLPYLGAPAGNSPVWIDLDPSFKFREARDPHTDLLLPEIGLNPNVFLNQIKMRSTVDTENHYVTALPQHDFMIPQIEEWAFSVENYFTKNHLDFDSLLRSQNIQREEFGRLPASLPFRAISENAIFSSIPETAKFKVQISISSSDEQTNVIQQELATADLFDKRITVSYKPASSLDEAYLEAHQSENEINAYLVELLPKLDIEADSGEEPLTIVGTEPIGMGFRQNMDITVIAPGGTQQKASKQLIAGSAYAVVFDLQNVTDEIMTNRQKELQEAWDSDDQMGLLKETLHIAGLNYFYQMDKLNEISSAHLNVSARRTPSIAVVSYELDVKDVLGLPLTATAFGIQLDVIKDDFVPIAHGKNDLSERQFMIASAITGSSIASSSLEQLFQTSAVSAAKVLEIANESHVPIYTVTNDTLTQLLPKLLQLDAPILEAIENFVNAGSFITVPETPVQIGSETSSAFAAVEPVTGASGFFTASKLNGSSTSLTYLRPSSLIQPGNLLDYQNLSSYPADWLNIMSEASLQISYSYLPAAASISSWFQNSEEIDEAATTSSVLSILGPVNRIANEPKISTPIIQNGYFSPKAETDTCSASAFDNLPHECTGLKFAVTRNAGWKVEIKNAASSELVRTFSGTTPRPQIIWDGTKDDELTQVSDGIYEFEITAQANPPSGAHASNPQKGTFIVDTIAPTLEITQPQWLPAPGPEVEAGQIFWVGTISDDHFEEYTVQISNGTSTFTDPDNHFHEPVINNAFFLWETGTAPLGSGYAATVQARDKAGNATELILPFRLVPYQALRIRSPQSEETVSQNMQSVVQVNDAAIGKLKYFMGNSLLGETSNVLPGIYTDEWPLWSFQTGDYQFKVEAYDHSGVQLIETDHRSIHVQGVPGNIHAVHLSGPQPNPFDPLSGGTADLTATLNQNANWRITYHAKPSSDGTQNLLFDSGVHFGNTAEASWNGHVNGRALLPQVLDGYLWHILDPAVDPNLPGNRYMLAWFELAIDPPPPNPNFRVDLSLPETQSQIRGIVRLKGRVYGVDNEPVISTVYYRTVGSSSWTKGSSTTVPVGVDMTVLGTLDTTSMANDAYEVFVQAEDNQQPASNIANSLISTYIVSRGIKFGNYTHSSLDLDIDMDGYRIQLTRKYDSNRAGQLSDFGHGWEIDLISTKVERVGNYDLMLTLPDGTRHYVEFKPEPKDFSFNGGLSGFVEARYYDTTPGSGLTFSVSGEVQLIEEPKGSGRWYTLEYIPWERAFNPSRLSVQSRQGETIRFDSYGNIKSIGNLRGRQVNFTDNGISIDGEQKITFVRNTNGTVKEILAPGGIRLEYGYDAAHDLRTFKHTFYPSDQKGFLIEYDYGDGSDGGAPAHFLTEIREQIGWNGTLPEMVTRVENAWKNNKLDLTGDGSGRGSQFQYDPEEKKAVSFDIMGRPTTYYYDDFGNVSSIVDPAGGEISYTYDEYGNKLTKTDPFDNVTTYEYPVMYGATDIFGGHYEGWTKQELYAKLNPAALQAHLYTFYEFWNGIPSPSLISLPSGEVQTYEYDRHGNVLRARGPLHFIEHAYTPTGELKLETDAHGNQTVYGHNTDGTVSTVTSEAFDRETFYGYENGRISEIIQNSRLPQEQQSGVMLHYNDLGLVEQQFDVFGTTLTESQTIGYSDQGDVESLSAPDLPPIDLKRTPMGEPLEITVASDGISDEQKIRYEYFKKGETWPGEDPKLCEGKLKQILYQLNPPKTGQTVMLRKEYHYAYDRTTEKTIYSNNEFEETTSYLDGNIASQLSRDNVRLSYKYDDAGRLSEVYKNEVLVSKRSFNDRGDLISTWDLSGGENAQVIYDYDEIGRIKSKIYPNGRTELYTYDKQTGQVESITDDRGSTSYTYNAAGNIVKIVHPDKTYVSFTYDASERVIKQTNELNQETQFEYDNEGRLIRAFMDPNPLDASATDPLILASYQYPDENTMVTEDALGRWVKYENFPADDPLVLSRKTLMDGSTYMTYQITEETGSHTLQDSTITWSGKQVVKELNDDIVENYFDDRGQLVAKHYLSTNVWIHYERTRIDGLLQERILNPNGITRLLYNEKELPQEVILPTGKTIVYSYEGTQVSGIEIPEAGYSVSYQFDPITHRLTLVETDSESASFGYDSFGRLDHISYSNEVMVKYFYDAVNRVKEIRYEKSGSAVKRLVYDLQPNGQVKQVDEYDGALKVKTSTYEYDALGRLLQEKINGSPTFSYTYFDNGSIKTKTIHAGGVVHRFTYDENNQLETESVSDGRSYSYQYDANGRLKERLRTGALYPVEKYSYDEEGRLLTVEKSENGNHTPEIITYEYTPDGRRSQRTANGEATQYVVDTSRPHSQILFEEMGSHPISYFHGNGTPLFLRSDDLYRFIHADRNHNVQFLTDATGAVTDTYSYEPFGAPTHVGTSLNAFQFAGEYYDEKTGLYDLRSRWYHPGLAQFLTRDSFIPPAGDFINLNPYSYVFNDPLNRIDPSGQMSLAETITVGFIFIMAGYLLIGASYQMKKQSERTYAMARLAEFDPAFYSPGIAPGLYYTAGREQVMSNQLKTMGEQSIYQGIGMIGSELAPYAGQSIYRFLKPVLSLDPGTKAGLYETAVSLPGSALDNGLGYVSRNRLNFFDVAQQNVQRLELVDPLVTEDAARNMLRYYRAVDRLTPEDKAMLAKVNIQRFLNRVRMVDEADLAGLDMKVITEMLEHQMTLTDEAEMVVTMGTFHKNPADFEAYLYPRGLDQGVDFERFSDLLGRKALATPSEGKIYLPQWQNMEKWSDREFINAFGEELFHWSRSQRVGRFEHFREMYGAGVATNRPYSVTLEIEAADKLRTARLDRVLFSERGSSPLKMDPWFDVTDAIYEDDGMLYAMKKLRNHKGYQNLPTRSQAQRLADQAERNNTAEFYRRFNEWKAGYKGPK